MIWIQRYHDWAFRLEKWQGSDTVLHICAGLGIWLVASIVMRRSMRDPWTLLPVIGAEGFNEACDYIVAQGWSLRDTIHDIAWTLFWPVVLQQYLARSGARIE